DAGERSASLNAKFVPSPCGLLFLPDRMEVHLRNCSECQAAEAVRIAKKAAAARRRAEKHEEEELEEEERSRKAAEERSRKAAEEAAELMEEEAAAKDPKRASGAAVNASADDGPSELVPCDYCGRTFFSDRLQVHLRSCQKKSLGVA
ncbi:unnamed protein product, partial [Polarella glacialis]